MLIAMFDVSVDPLGQVFQAFREHLLGMSVQALISPMG